jgi:hypothetical protein
LELQVLELYFAPSAAKAATYDDEEQRETGQSGLIQAVFKRFYA